MPEYSLGPHSIPSQLNTPALPDVRVVATRGSIIYFVIAGLSNIDPMYQYSLRFYKELFSIRLKRAEEHEDVSERLRQEEKEIQQRWTEHYDEGSSPNLYTMR